MHCGLLQVSTTTIRTLFLQGCHPKQVTHFLCSVATCKWSYNSSTYPKG